jgi:hypothetical protein
METAAAVAATLKSASLTQPTIRSAAAQAKPRACKLAGLKAVDGSHLPRVPQRLAR